MSTIHKDPFDRLLVSTALAEDLTIITANENVRRYKHVLDLAIIVIPLTDKQSRNRKGASQSPKRKRIKKSGIVNFL